MLTLTPKTIRESQTEQVQILMPEHINGDRRLFGGKLMEWIDVVAAVVARRHSNRNVTTVCVDHLVFKSAARVNNTIVLKGVITYVGHTSMEIRVDTYVEKLSGEQEAINSAYLVMVALDENETPTAVPPILLETEKQKAEFNAGKQRSMDRKKRAHNGSS